MVSTSARKTQACGLNKEKPFQSDPLPFRPELGWEKLQSPGCPSPGVIRWLAVRLSRGRRGLLDTQLRAGLLPMRQREDPGRRRVWLASMHRPLKVSQTVDYSSEFAVEKRAQSAGSTVST